VLVTHSREAAAIAERVIELKDGRVISDESPRSQVPSPESSPDR
jgi:ABC-type lipoprotein export system ATPase subunit